MKPMPLIGRKSGTLKIIDCVYAGRSNGKLTLKCPRNHEYTTSYSNYYMNRWFTQSCRTCRQESLGDCSIKVYQNTIIGRTFGELTVTGSCGGKNPKYTVQCAEGHEYRAFYAEISRYGGRCKLCHGRKPYERVAA